MQTIDVETLVTVMGGTQAAQPQPGAGQAGGAAQGAAPGGGFLSGLQSFFSFLQSPQFQQLIGGFQQLIGSLGGAASQTGAPCASPGAAATGGAPAQPQA